MKTLFVSAVVLILSGSLSKVSAQTATPVATERQVNQQERIQQGAASGSLTPRETRRLEARQAKVAHDKREAKADGVVTPAEKRKLNREQNRNSRAIRRQKHDAQTQH
jgi:hypothetical protein